MEHSKSLKKVIDIILVSTILLNVFGAPIAKKFNLPTFFITAIPLIFLFTINLKIKQGKLDIRKNIKFYIVISVFVCILHILKSIIKSEIGLGNNEFKYLLYILTFLTTSSVIKIENWYAVEFSLIGISLFLSFDALQYLPLMISTGTRIYNVTNYTLLDKPVYTLILTLTVVCLLINILERKRSNRKISKYLMILLALFLSGINIVLIQSKLFVLVLTVVFFLLFLFVNKISRKNVFLFFLLVFAGVITCFLIFPKYVPDYIYIFLNRYLGIFNNVVSNIQAYDRYAATYHYRNAIYMYSFNLFLNNFFVGVGFGNYKKYAVLNSLLLNGVIQTESSYMNLLVEGGIIYFSLHMSFLFSLFCKLWKKQYYNEKTLYSLKMFLLLISYFILNTGNDFYSIQYWIILAFIYQVAIIKDKKLWNL